MSKHLISLAAAALALALVTPAIAQQQGPSKAEQMIKYRQAGFGWLAYNIGPIGAMAKGTIPFDAKVVERNAATMAAIAPRLLEGFPEGSGSGARTEARPEIWTDMADFRAKMGDLERATADLAVASRSGDMKVIGPALGKVGGACKSCHDKFKKKD